MYDNRPLSYWRAELSEEFGFWIIKPEIPLGRNGDPKALPILLALIADPEPAIRRKTAYCLSYLKENAKPAIPHLIKLMADPDDDLRIAAAVALGAIGNAANDSKAVLLKAAADKNFRLRYEATEALWYVTRDVRLVLPLLQEMVNYRKPILEFRHGELQCMVARLLGEIGPLARETTPDLIRLIQDYPDHYYVRTRAAKALGSIGPPAKEAIPTLRGALKDPDICPRVAAAVALWRITGEDDEKLVEEVRQALREALAGPYATDVEQAVESLGDFGSKAKVAIPDLLAVLDRPDKASPGSNRSPHILAREALKKIDPAALRKIKREPAQ
jgi:HEAT repeat protein